METPTGNQQHKTSGWGFIRIISMIISQPILRLKIATLMIGGCTTLQNYLFRFFEKNQSH